MAHPPILSTVGESESVQTLDLANSIYLDHQATTPLDPRVRKAMAPYLADQFGNPHSSLNKRGQAARRAVETSREAVAASVGCRPECVIFTSGATESNNLAILGYARRNRDRGRHLVISEIEHQSVRGAAMALRSEGFDVTFAPASPDGIIRPKAVESAMRDDTILVSVMGVNNEIGTIQPIAEIAAITERRGVAFHSDGSQALGNISVDLGSTKIDFLSITSHKIYGPPGIGALIIRNPEDPGLQPIAFGGGQEMGLRPGTVPMPYCVGFGYAAMLAEQERVSNVQRMTELRKQLVAALVNIEGFFLNGHATSRVANNLNFGFAEVPSERLLTMLPHLQMSTVSACASGRGGVSHVLKAMKCDEQRIRSSIRLGIGRTTRPEEIALAARSIAQAVGQINGRRRA